MQIEENLFVKSMDVNSQDPYYISMEFMRKMSGKGKIIDNENTCSSNGPFNRSDVSFDLVQNLDGFSSLRISFYLTGENHNKNSLRIDVAASFISGIEDKGFFTEIFTEFYLQNVFPIMRKIAGSRIKNIIELSEEVISDMV